ncbi:unnamed protein product [Urochloa humidicola]
MEPSSSTSAATSSSHRGGGGGRELQGPRPAPLRVRRKDSHNKIRKPPPPPQQVREPVIIYTVSPKVVHAQPSEFMSVVQRLTGTAAAAAPPHHHHHQIIPTTSSAALLLPPPPAPAPHFPFQLPQHHHYQAGGPHELSPAARSCSGGLTSSGLLMPPFPGILSPADGPPPPPGAGINSLFLGAGTAAQAAGGTIGHQNQMLQAEASPSSGPYYWGWGDLFNNNQQHYHQN